jgi:hypothetical protein
MGYTTTAAEIDAVIERLVESVAVARAMGAPAVA